MRKTLLLIVILIFGGCVPTPTVDTYNQKYPFRVETSDQDKFSDKSTIVIKSSFNRVSYKNALGIIETKENIGLMLNPRAIIIDNKTNIYLDAFYLGTYFSQMAMYSGFNTISSIVFIVNNKDRIEVPFSFEDKKVFWGSYKEQSHNYYEAAIGKISFKDFEKIALAKEIDIKVVGGDRTQTYNNDELTKDFILNIKQFYDRLISLTK